MTTIGVAVLGPVRVCNDGVDVDLGTQRQREIVTALALAGGDAVPSSVLIERVWGDEAPASALATLHGYVASLRRAIEPDRPPRAPATVLVTHGDGYLLRVPAQQRDDVRFEALVSSAHARLGVVPDHLRPRVPPSDREEVEAALDELDDALALWRGTPYAELGTDPVAQARRTRLEDRHRLAVELRAVGQLALGRHDMVLTELQARTAAYPLHERWWALRAVALTRESRQGEALAVLDELREHLAEELGVDPSAPLQELRTAILRQDASVVADVSRPVAVAPTRPSGTTLAAAAWPLAGRDADLAALRRALDEAADGQVGFVALTGDPGIGKSRLVEDLAREAVDRGWWLAVGQCSQDDSAPPLWPWLAVLDAIGSPFEQPEPGLEGGGPFRVRADLAQTVRDAAVEQPLLVVLEDLHWADASTLGVLRLLAETGGPERLLVVATWRTQEESTLDLGAVAEALARRHAVRRDLTGLDVPATAAVFEEVAGRPLPEPWSSELHRRTDGNPFFVVELARLAAGDDRELGELLASATLPTAVAEVIDRRVAVLPDASASVLRTAAVIGRTFDLDTLGDVMRIGPDELLDAVEPALEAGLVAEDGVDVFRFSHALVGDVLCASMTATRLARTHRLVAELLESRPGREAEVAWHWRSAGAAHVGRAWRASGAAADAAARVYGFVDAAELVETALALQAVDPEAGPQDELRLLQQAIDVYRLAAMLPELVAAVERAIGVARALGDDLALARVATQTTHRMLWRSAPFGAINAVVVDALRHAWEVLPESEVELRCRVRVSLANELREETTVAEREELCREALALARSLDDPALLCDVLLHTGLSTWTSRNAEHTLAAADEAAGLARVVGDRHALVMALTMATVTLGELGRAAEMRRRMVLARAEATAMRMVYADLVLDEIDLAWTAAAGDFEACERMLVTIEEKLSLLSRTGLDPELALDRHFDLFALRLWQGRPLEALPGIDVRVEAGFPLEVFAVVALCRAGRPEEAARRFHPEELEALFDRELAFSCPIWCGIAEASLYLGHAELAAGAGERLAPYAGRSSGADGLFFGPADAFLALAARASGDTEAAGRHAERALELIEEWQVPRARAWLEDLRAAYAF